MASPNRRTNASVVERLASEPSRFDFFQAVRLLELLGLQEGRAALGEDAELDAEAVSLKVLPALSFSAGSVAKMTPAAAGQPAELSLTFTGLSGPNGVLPQHYTTLLLSRLRLKDTTLRDFFDLFHHRFFSLFYRAWRARHLVADVEHAKTTPAKPNIPATQALYAWVGLNTAHLRGRTSISDEVYLHFSGAFARQARSATQLEQLLSHYFGWPVTVEELHGRWLYLDLENRGQLPLAGVGRGLNSQLGQDAIIGRRVWDVQSEVRLRVGPLKYRQFRQLLPEGDARKAFQELTRSYLRLELDFDVQLVLEPDEVPWCQLTHTEANRPRLGRTAWVRSHNFGKPVADAVFPGE